MANIKRVEIVGMVPFNCHEHEDMLRHLGQLNAPISGLRVHWISKAGYLPSEHGGKTCMINFRVHGEEAVRFEYLDSLCQAIIDSGGYILIAKAKDIEDNGIFENLKYHGHDTTPICSASAR